MRTYEIPKEMISGVEAITEGYKVVKYDNGTKQAFRYGEKGESLVGRVFKCDGNIEECKWGLHFSKDPANVFNFYEPLGYNKYFKVKAYGNTVDSKDGLKTVAQIIEFVEEYDIMEYIKIIKAFDRSAVRDSYAVIDSSAVNNSYAVSCSYGLKDCEAVKYGIFCYKKEGAKYVLFNKKTTKARYEEVMARIRSFEYIPHWENFYELKGNKEWYSIAFPELMNVSNKTAWSKMTNEMREYIQSLPEYDDKIFKAITE